MSEVCAEGRKESAKVIESVAGEVSPEPDCCFVHPLDVQVSIAYRWPPTRQVYQMSLNGPKLPL